MIYSVLSGKGYNLYKSRFNPEIRKLGLSGTSTLGNPPILSMLPPDAKFIGSSNTPIGTIVEKQSVGMLIASIVSAFAIYWFIKRR